VESARQVVDVSPVSSHDSDIDLLIVQPEPKNRHEESPKIGGAIGDANWPMPWKTRNGLSPLASRSATPAIVLRVCQATNNAPCNSRKAFTTP
jgi:hypothetical protein